MKTLGLTTLIVMTMTGAAFAGESQMTMPMSGVINKVKADDYHAVREVDLDQGIYKIDALDKNDQEVEIRINAATGQYVPVEHTTVKRDIASVASGLEKQGNTPIKIKREGTSYKVKMINPKGHTKKATIDANQKMLGDADSN